MQLENASVMLSGKHNNTFSLKNTSVSVTHLTCSFRNFSSEFQNLKISEVQSVEFLFRISKFQIGILLCISKCSLISTKKGRLCFLDNPYVYLCLWFYLQESLVNHALHSKVNSPASLTPLRFSVTYIRLHQQ